MKRRLIRIDVSKCKSTSEVNKVMDVVEMVLINNKVSISLENFKK